MNLQRTFRNILPFGCCYIFVYITADLICIVVHLRVHLHTLFCVVISHSVSDVCTGKLYAVGGYDGASRQCLSTVEEFNPVTNKWCYVADMSTRRSGAG